MAKRVRKSPPPRDEHPKVFTPHFLASIFNSIVLLATAAGIFFKMHYDVQAAKETISELTETVESANRTQSTSSEKVARLETRVEILTGTVNRIDDRISQLFTPNGGPAPVRR